MSQSYNIGAGTNFLQLLPGSTVTRAGLTDENGLAIFVTCSTAGESQLNTYAKGCLLLRTDTGALYQNTNTSAAAPTWSINGTGASGTSGATGASGTSGTSGTSGFSGTSGTSGKSGTSGTSA
jgi:hypothetical protein